MMLSRRAPGVAEMLAEIQSETGAQLLSSILYQTSPLGSTGLPGLDVHLLSSAATRASPTSSLNRGDVLEIQGPAASGKTQLVYYLTMQCILPEKISLPDDTLAAEVEIGGWEKSAVIIDADGRWNLQRFKSLLAKRLQKSLPKKHSDIQELIQDVIKDSLQRLHIFQVKSSASLAATLFRLPLYHSEHMADEEIALLVIDSISSFYWTDRYNLERQQRHQRQDSSERRDTMNPLHRVLNALQEIRLRHGLVTVLTNWGLTPMTGGSNADSGAATPSPFYRQHLDPFPAPFDHPLRIPPYAHLMPPITHHITLTPPSYFKIPSEMTSLREALETMELDSAEIEREEIRGILRIQETGSTTTCVIHQLE